MTTANLVINNLDITLVETVKEGLIKVFFHKTFGENTSNNIADIVLLRNCDKNEVEDDQSYYQEVNSTLFNVKCEVTHIDDKGVHGYFLHRGEVYEDCDDMGYLLYQLTLYIED